MKKVDNKKNLDNKTVMSIWNSLEKPSLAAVRTISGAHGYLNPDTGNPYSRQWIRILMSQTAEGRIKLGGREGSVAFAQMGKPVIVEDRKEYLNWYLQNGFVGYTIIAPNKVTVPLIQDKYVYGDLPISLARYARSVWLPELEGNECRMSEFKVRRIV